MSDPTSPISRLNAALEGRYAIERELGEGGMATVYLATDLKHERQVALKVLKPELAALVGAERFLTEIKTTANLQHPHILPLHDSGEADSFLFYVMPYVEGESLRDRLDREQQLHVDEAVNIAKDLAEALDYAHRNKVIHRDIKPANILMHEGRPLIADFGIALAVGAAGGTRLTETGLSVGTPYYMSPEQATGDQILGAASDIYALACVLYEMLVGEPPYSGNTAQAVLGKIIAGGPVSATAHRPSIPAHVDAALRCALEKLPADRFTSAQEFADTMGNEHFRYGEPADTAVADARPWKQRAMAFASLAGVLALALGWVMLRPGAAEPPDPIGRFSLALGELQGADGHFNISPDGSAMVFRAPSANGDLQLWLRRWDNLTPMPVPGTEGEGTPNTPVISPDGNEVAFVAGGQVKVAPLQGGVVRTLADSALCCSRWGPDGFIYYSPFDRTIKRVPAQGGAVEPITKRDQEGDGPHGDFQVLPGGEIAVFTVWGDPDRIDAMRLATGERKTLAPGVKPYVTPTGHLIFASLEGRILAAPLDIDGMELTGAPVPIVEGVVVSSNDYPFYSVSQTGTLVYWSGDTSTGGREFVWVERTGVATPVDPGWTFERGNVNSGWSLSPDDTRLALRARTEAGLDIWIKELDDGPLSRLTFHEAQERMPRWTPDGRTVTFISNRGGDYDVWSKADDGTGEAELVLDSDAFFAQGFFSPDGEWLIMRIGGAAGVAGGRDILAMRPGVDSVPLPLLASELDEAGPALSPDGRWLAYNSDETGRYEVFVRPFPDVNAGKWQVSTEGGHGPLWAHSGRELFFVNNAFEMVAAQVETESGFRVRERQTLFAIPPGYEGRGNNSFIVGLYDIASDDERFLMVRPFQDAEETSNELILVQNFFEELKRRVGN